MPKGIPLTRKEFEEKRYEIAHKAADLILEKGYTETSVKKIAKAVGIGKSTLYDYFSTKDEIIIYLLDELLAELMQGAKKILNREESAAECLRNVMCMHLRLLMRNKSYLLKLTLEAQKLGSKAQQDYQVRRYAYQDLIIDLIDDGINEGSFRPVNSAIVMKTLMAVLSTITFTSRPVGSPDKMLEDALDLILKGIQA